MNICIITSSFPSRPDDLVQAPFLIPLIEGLQRREHRVFIFTQDRKGKKEEFIEGTRIRWFPWIGSDKPLVHLNPLRPIDGLRIGSLFLAGRKELLPFIEENRIDVCLALWVLPNGAFACHAHRRSGIPYSVWALGSDIYRYSKNPLLRPIMKKIVEHAKGVFADGFDLCRRVEEQLGRKCFFLATTRSLGRDDGSDRNDIACNRRDVACNVSTRDACIRTYRFLFVGRLEKVKGIDVLLHAMVLLKAEKADVHLTIIGRGEMEQWARGFVKKKGLGEAVSFTGNISDGELAMHYRSSDCVVVPSRSESIPLVFSEALEFDRDLIVTDVGDMGMLGRRYGAAWVVPPENPEAFKQAMKRRFESGDRNERGGEDRRAELRHLFDMETSVERFLADY